MLEDKLRIQAEADSLSQRLEAVLRDKFERRSFDADTPIDKTLGYLQCVIRVGSLPHPSNHIGRPLGCFQAANKEWYVTWHVSLVQAVVILPASTVSTGLFAKGILTHAWAGLGVHCKIGT